MRHDHDAGAAIQAGKRTKKRFDARFMPVPMVLMYPRRCGRPWTRSCGLSPRESKFRDQVGAGSSPLRCSQWVS